MTRSKSDRPDEALRRALEKAERELVARLEEPCQIAPQDPGKESTVDLLQLEDSLLAAARAAERVIELRRRCTDNGLTERGERVLLAEELPVAPSSESVREFSALDGAHWRVWAVKPAASRAGAVAQRFLEEYRDGWLAFEALDGSARRRLPGIPQHWAGRDESALRELFEVACPAKPRRGPGDREVAAAEADGGSAMETRRRQAEGAAG